MMVQNGRRAGPRQPRPDASQKIDPAATTRTSAIQSECNRSRRFRHAQREDARTLIYNFAARGRWDEALRRAEQVTS